MDEREMRTTVESVRTMLLHMGVQHHWWHLALRQAVWVRNCLERSTTPPGTTLYQLLTGKKPDLTLARVWGCMVQFMVLDLTNNKVVTSVNVIFYVTLSLEVWKAKFGPASGRMQAHPPMDTSTATVPLLAEVDEPAYEDVVEILPPSPVLAPTSPVAYRPALTYVSATGDEGSLEALLVAQASFIAGGRQGTRLVEQDGKPSTTGEQQTRELVEQEAAVGVQSTGEQQTRQSTGELSKSTGDDAEEDEELLELDPDMHADLEHRWDITTMTVKERMASWKGEAVKATMEEEMRSLIGMGTWELVERPCKVNIMKNRLVVKGFTQVCGADYDETNSPVSGYVTLRIFLSIVAVLDLNLMQLDMKNAFLQSKLDRVL
ncbi:unnamed protein product [Closterium sp. NIES-53]